MVFAFDPIRCFQPRLCSLLQVPFSFLPSVFAFGKNFFGSRSWELLILGILANFPKIGRYHGKFFLSTTQTVNFTDHVCDVSLFHDLQAKLKKIFIVQPVLRS